MRRLSLALVVFAAGCGGGSSGGPAGPTPPPPPEPASQTFSGSVVVYGVTSHAYQATRAGTLTATLTWTGGADLDLYVTAADCTGYPPDACVILQRSAAATGSSEAVTRTVSANERLILWIDNFSTTTAASYTLVVTLTPS